MTREQLSAFINAIKALRGTIDDETALTAPAFFPAWQTDTAYTTDTRVRYDGILYKCLQSHTSQEAWTPTDAPSLWARVLIPDPEVIPEWVQPDSTNPYMTGDKVRYNGKVYESIVDNNVWPPDVYGWVEVS